MVLSIHSSTTTFSKVYIPMFLDLVEGGWTPALRAMALDIMDKLITRPISIAVTRPTGERNSTLSGIRAKLVDHDYQNVESWQSDVVTCISNCRATGRGHINEICDELSRAFEKMYKRLKQYSEFRFRDACEQVYFDLRAVEPEI
jgi:hypothetical protein